MGKTSDTVVYKKVAKLTSLAHVKKWADVMLTKLGEL